MVFESSKERVFALAAGASVAMYSDRGREEMSGPCEGKREDCGKEISGEDDWERPVSRRRTEAPRDWRRDLVNWSSGSLVSQVPRRRIVGGESGIVWIQDCW